MTLTSAIGLMAFFLVDFADLYFLSLLGITEITAAIGFSGMIAFSALSLSLGIGIAASALVARNLGAGNIERARQYATSTMTVSIIVPMLVTISVWLFAGDVLTFLGARGTTTQYGQTYLNTVALGFPLMGGALSFSFILRALGDARRAMYVTLLSAIGNAILDPIFIFGFDLSIRGAAIATVSANLISFLAGLYGLQKTHKFLAPFNFKKFTSDAKAISAIAFPVIATQLATPFAMAYITRITAPFGDEAVAGTAIINRLVPLSFGLIFSLSGAVGPIIGQNFGAGQMHRLRETISKSLMLNAAYTLGVATILILLSAKIPVWFHARGEAGELVSFFCLWVAWVWIFAGSQYVAQASFNNLGKPVWSTMFNWGKATIGTIPFVHIGAYYWGPKGIMAGYAAGIAIFGILAVIAAYVLISRLEKTGK